MSSSRLTIRKALISEIHQGSFTCPPPPSLGCASLPRGKPCFPREPPSSSEFGALRAQAEVGNLPVSQDPSPRGVAEGSRLRHLHGPAEVACVLDRDAGDAGSQAAADPSAQLERRAVV